MNKQLKLELPEPILEEDYTRLSRSEMSVWDDEHPRPESGPAFERKLLKQLHEQAQGQLRQMTQSLPAYRDIIGGAWQVLIGRNLAQAGVVSWVEKSNQDCGRYSRHIGLLRNSTYSEELPAVLLRPKQARESTVVWLSDHGKSGLFSPSGTEPSPEVAKLLDKGFSVLGLDLFEQGEFRPDGQPLARNRTVKNPREAPAYTYGYNRALFAQRVDDVLTALSYLQRLQAGAAEIELVALDGTGPIAAVARAEARQGVHRCAVNTGGFRFGKLLDYRDANFLPGAAKYDDLPGALALNAPADLWIAGEGDDVMQQVHDRYDQAAGEDRLEAFKGTADKLPTAAIEWLLQD